MRNSESQTVLPSGLAVSMMHECSEPANFVQTLKMVCFNLLVANTDAMEYSLSDKIIIDIHIPRCFPKNVGRHSLTFHHFMTKNTQAC